jgi:transposase-like protein
MPRKRSRPWKVADARAVLNELAASALSVSAFARREGLDDDRLYRWRRRFAGERKTRGVAALASTPALIEIHPRPPRAEPVEIVLASGVTLRVAETIDPSALARLITVLR